MESSFSKPERELLKAIYRLTFNGDAAHTSDVAERLGVTAGTVTVGVKRLADRGLVLHRPYRGVELSDEGRTVAVAVMRRHRIVERFLVDYLNYSGTEADEMAATFEHHLPQEVEDRIYAELGKPECCPHGNTIPGRAAIDLAGASENLDLRKGAVQQ